MRRFTFSSLFLACVVWFGPLLAGCGLSPATQPAAQPTAQVADSGSPYKIGFITSVTGAASFLGEPERDVAVMIQRQLDAQGGIVGSDSILHPVEIIIQDTQGSSDVAVPVVKKLIDTEKVLAIIGPATSPESMALIPVVQEAQVPMISMASSSSIVKPVAERRWVFKVAQSNEHTSPWQVRHAKAKGLAKIANVHVDNAYGAIVLATLKTLPEGLSVEEQRTSVRDAIEQTGGFVGVDGVFNFSADDHVGLSLDDVVLVRISEGKWAYLPPEQW